jgi:DNA helicase-2/ATP-dependent DNA helicase PcrA
VIADLHIHSRFSRATSRELSFVSLHRAALDKGIELVGTGDVTHPGWMAEIEGQLEDTGGGLFRLKPDLARDAEQGLPASCAGEVRFVLQVEISNIYKRDGRVRKNHNLVFLPSLDAAHRFGERLAAIGNLASDGRPILGLDARDLLEITLETDPLAFLVPAHIWTPWFSLLGSKSGFDSLEECFGDLSDRVFAAETGLSSDPPMNWRLSGLDRLTLISNSDAHSLGTLGREANLLDIEPSFEALRGALETRHGFLGTLEFYPEEGKYHLDGHRKCGLRLEPEDTRRLEGRCPSCGGLITVGVMSRVLELADRHAGFTPESAIRFERLVPLAEVVAEVVGVGASSKRVRTEVARLVDRLGPELTILRDVAIEVIGRIGGGLLAEAVRRVRTGELEIAAGYDGEFGTVRIFAEGERRALAGQKGLFGPPKAPPPQPVTRSRTDSPARPAADGHAQQLPVTPAGDGGGLDAGQHRAVAAPSPLLIVAGPGTGKTRTLVARIAHQVGSERLSPKQLLAIAFTNQAADELRRRIRSQVPGAVDGAPLVTTFHGLGHRLLGELTGVQPEVLDDEHRIALVQRAVGGGASRDARRLVDRISLAKQSCDPWQVLADSSELAPVIARYQDLLEDQGAVDVDDLVLRPYQLMSSDPPARARLADRWRSIAVDEYQDVNDVQAALIDLLAPDGTGLCAIGDPDQAIYGFRGARPGHFDRFASRYPHTTVVRLDTSYRLTSEIETAARAVLGCRGPLATTRHGPPVELIACPTADSEGEQVVVRIERILGGSSSFAVDTGRGQDPELEGVGFGDIAVLCRTRAQRRQILEALGRSGIPCSSIGEDEPHDPRSEKVAVMTLHAAKGREFEVVFVAGVERGLVPLERDGQPADPDEERRLLYVAMTRARRLLVLSWAARRTLWGRQLPGAPSPFLNALTERTVVRSTPDRPAAGSRSRQMRLF